MRHFWPQAIKHSSREQHETRLVMLPCEDLTTCLAQSFLLALRASLMQALLCRRALRAFPKAGRNASWLKVDRLAEQHAALCLEHLDLMQGLSLA